VIPFSSPCLFKIRFAYSCETCQWLKCPLNGLRAQSRVSPVVGLLPLASGPACFGIAFPPFGHRTNQYGNSDHINILPSPQTPLTQFLCIISLPLKMHNFIHNCDFDTVVVLTQKQWCCAWVRTFSLRLCQLRQYII
jgi:hypothetical protein